MDSVAEAIVREIRDAFRGVERGSITLHEAEAIDDYASARECAEARNLDTEECWEDVPDQHVEACTAALSHVDPQSWRYYIAPYMIWTLRNSSTNNSIVSDYTVYALAPSSTDRELYEYSMARYRMLSEPQSAAVYNFLRYMAATVDNADDVVATEALEAYWNKFAPESDE